MISCKFSIVAHGACIDAQSGGLTIFDIVDEIRAGGFPLLFQRIAFITKIERDIATDPNTFDGTIRVLLDDDVLVAGPIHGSFADKSMSSLVTRLEGLIIAHPGRLSFRLSVGDQVLGEYNVAARLIGPPTFDVAIAPVPG
jgi:hypothetical protein